MNIEEGTTMKTRQGIFSIFTILAVMLVLLTACTSQRTGGTVSDKGDHIEITTQDHSVKAMKAGAMEDTFVVFTANRILNPDSLKYLDGHLVTMTKKDADQLKAQYGDFTNTLNKGHDIARKSVKYFSLLAADGTVQKQINKLIKLNSQRKFPLIKISMDEIKVTDLMYKNSKVTLSGEFGKQYLVNKIDILENNNPI
jgi:hypothetical protein